MGPLSCVVVGRQMAFAPLRCRPSTALDPLARTAVDRPRLRTATAARYSPTTTLNRTRHELNSRPALRVPITPRAFAVPRTSRATHLAAVRVHHAPPTQSAVPAVSASPIVGRPNQTEPAHWMRAVGAGAPRSLDTTGTSAHCAATGPRLTSRRPDLD